MHSQKQPNHECRNCCKMYYSCNDCERIHSWKAVCCSIECYDEYTEKIIRSRMPKQSKSIEESIEVEQQTDTEVTNPKVRFKKINFKSFNKEVK